MAYNYNKVVISGINTSSLTVLKEDEKMALLKEYKETGSKQAKDRLVNGNLRLVLSVIQKFMGRGEDVDDLFQIGVVEEVCKEVDAPKHEVVIALESISEPVSLYEPVYSDNGDTLYIIDQIGDTKNPNEWIDDIVIKEVVDDLSTREKKILDLRFYQGKTQIEVANEIGISQAQVSRLEKNALNKIKSAI